MNAIKHVGYLALFVVMTVLFSLVSCENEDISFSDFDYQTIYFATQTPIRTITLGDDVYPTDDDNAHRFYVYATLGGVETNKKDRQVEIQVDKSLCQNMYYDDGAPVTPLPDDYYTLTSNTIIIPQGEIIGGVEVQLTDLFFEDPKSTETYYVLPLRMISASDSILSGKPLDNVLDPNPVDNSDWDVVPRNYTLYALKYKNKYHGCWLSTGTDYIHTYLGDSISVRQPEYIENADLVYITTDALNIARYNVSVNIETLDDNGDHSIETKSVDLILTFDDDDNCTITSETDEFVASGEGKWEYKAALKAWNDTDRDQLTLNYSFSFEYASEGISHTATVEKSEVLVMRDRQNKYETFSYTIQ